MDVSLLIKEVRKRPRLWDIRYLHRGNSLWSEVAKSLGCSVDDCREKWKSLCLMYQASKGQARKRLRTYDPYANNNDKVFLNQLQFVDNDEDDEIVDEIEDVDIVDEKGDVELVGEIEEVQIVDEIEDVQIVDEIEDVQIVDEIEDVQIVDEIEDLQIGNQIEDIQIVNQIRDKESDTLQNNSAATNVRNELQQKGVFPAKFDVAELDCSFLISFLFDLQSMSKTQNLKFRTKMSDLMLSMLNPAEIDESDSTNTLELINDKTFFRALINIGDSNCDFLLSYLPYVKSLPRLENMQFRVKMSYLILDILSS